MPLDSFDTDQLCRELIQMTNELEKGQEAAVHFMTWAARERCMKAMAERYHEADLRRISFGVFH